MKEERTGFVFLRSYYEAVKDLPKTKRLEVYDAICNYAFTDQWPETPTGTAKAVLQLIRPTLDKGLQNYKRAKENGKRGGNPNFRKGQSNPYYLPTDTKDNQKDNQPHNPGDNLDKDKDKDMDMDMDKEREKEMESPMGPYGNVLLSSEEKKRLQQLFPNTWQSEIDRLSEHLHRGDPLPCRRHYDAIRILFEQRIMGMAG